MKKMTLKIMLGSVILEAALICIFILAGKITDETTWRAISSVLFIFSYAIPCLFYSKIYDNEKYKYIAMIGAAAASISALIFILSIWSLIPSGESLGKIEGTLNIVVFMLVFVSWVLSYDSTNNLLNLFKKISISLIVILSFWLVIITWTTFPTGFLARLFWVSVVLTDGSYNCTLILTRIYRKELKKEEQKEMMNTDYNPNPMPQTSVAQTPLPTNSVQSQPLPPTQPMESPISSVNQMENIPTNLGNSENTPPTQPMESPISSVNQMENTPTNLGNSENTTSTQPIESSIPPMNPMANAPANPGNTENIVNNNNSENQIQQ